MNGIEVLKAAVALSGDIFASLAEDLKGDPMVRPCATGNHAMWSVGHMAISDRHFLYMMTGDENPLAGWQELFAGGTRPTDDASAYPPFEEVLAEFKAGRAAMWAKLDGMTDADLDKPAFAPPEGYEHVMGTIGACMVVAAIHPMHHRGQLADIRKVLTREPVMA